jgi:hypothetical protein
MGIVKTSTDLIRLVKNKASIPDDSSDLNTILLETLNEELLNLLPKILKVHEEFYVVDVDTTLVSGTSSYIIPHRAIGNKLRNISIKDSNNNFTKLTEIDLEDLPDCNYNKYSFYLKRNKVVFPYTTNTGTLVMNIYLRPNELVVNTRAATILAIDTDTGIITFSATMPTHFAASINYDFVCKNSPCSILEYDKTASAINISGKTLTFTTTDLPSDLTVGDYITISEETIVPQIPTEMISLLITNTAMNYLDSIGDFDAAAKLSKKIQKQEIDIDTIIDNRSEGTPKKVVNINSFFRQ